MPHGSSCSRVTKLDPWHVVSAKGSHGVELIFHLRDEVTSVQGSSGVDYGGGIRASFVGRYNVGFSTNC